MSVIQQTPYAQATGNGVTTAFPFQFLCLLKTDLSVYIDDVLKTVDVDYTVSGLGVVTGGTVTFISAPANTTIVAIIRAMTRTRATDYQNLGDFDANTVNPDFDRAILIEQDIDVQLGRSIRTPASEVATLMTLPTKANRGGKYMAFDPLGQPVPSSGTGNDSALRTDLASTTSGSDGSRLSGFRRTDVGSVGRSVYSVLNQFVSVKDFGAVGDGSTDDTAAIQAAIAARSYRGTVFMPAGVYKVTASLTAGAPVSLKAYPIEIVGEGQATQIVNAASASKPTFNFSGASQWSIRRVLLTGNSVNLNDGILVDGSATLNIRWEIDSVVAQMAGKGLVLKNTNSGVVRNFKSWPDNNSNALTQAQTVTSGDISHHIYLTGSFVHAVSFYDCDCLPSTGYAANQRGIKCDATAAYGIRIYGGDFGGESGTNNEIGIDLTNCTAFEISQPVHENSKVQLSNCSGGRYSANAISVGGGLVLGVNTVNNTFIGIQEATTTVDASAVGNTFIGCSPGTVTDSAVPPSRWINCVRFGQRGPDVGRNIRKIITYSASITPDCGNCDDQVIRVTNGTAFTVNAPSNPTDGFKLTLIVRNESGGVMGVVTWNATFKMSAWTNPANGQNRSITFEYDTDFAQWRQISQTGVDVPN